ncbi:Helix-turn-helix type 11 domain-containing protein [Enterobacter rongchengensis]
MGRLWQTLILSQWRAELAWLPVETLIHFQQARYYQILGQCDRASDCTVFVEFMLQNMAEALREGITMSSVMSEKMSEKEKAILELLTVQPQLTAVMLASALGVISRTAERYLHSLQAKGKLKRIGARKGGSWQVMA